MRRSGPPQAIAVLLTSSAVLAAPATASTDPSGVYSSVRYIPEAGDLLGMKVEVRTKPRPVVVVTICEGECQGGRTWPAVIRGRQISFSVVERLSDGQGERARRLTLSFVGRLEGHVLVVRQLGAGDVPDERLKRIR
jgi:hypothetical protein